LEEAQEQGEVMDIVERLRSHAVTGLDLEILETEAADEIEKLRGDCLRMASLAIDNAKDTGRAMRYRDVLYKIGYGPPHEGEPLELLNQFVDLARAELKRDE
jgi:hypothetical protein